MRENIYFFIKKSVYGILLENLNLDLNHTIPMMQYRYVKKEEWKQKYIMKKKMSHEKKKQMMEFRLGGGGGVFYVYAQIC